MHGITQVTQTRKGAEGREKEKQKSRGQKGKAQQEGCTCSDQGTRQRWVEQNVHLLCWIREGSRSRKELAADRVASTHEPVAAPTCNLIRASAVAGAMQPHCPVKAECTASLTKQAMFRNYPYDMGHVVKIYTFIQVALRRNS